MRVLLLVALLFMACGNPAEPEVGWPPQHPHIRVNIIGYTYGTAWYDFGGIGHMVRMPVYGDTGIWSLDGMADSIHIHVEMHGEAVWFRLMVDDVPLLEDTLIGDSIVVDYGWHR